MSVVGKLVSLVGILVSRAGILVSRVGIPVVVGSWWTWEGMVNLMDCSQC